MPSDQIFAWRLSEMKKFDLDTLKSLWKSMFDHWRKAAKTDSNIAQNNNKMENDPMEPDMMMKTLWMMVHSAEWWHEPTFGQIWKEWKQTLDLMPSDQILLEDSLKRQNLTLTL